MSTPLEIRYTTAAPGEPWQASTLVTFNGGVATVHHTNTNDVDSLLRAGRRIRNAGCDSVAFSAGWSMENQWLVSRGFINARGEQAVAWTGTAAERDELEARWRAYEWLRTQAHASPEELAPVELARRAATFLSSLSDHCTAEIVQGEALRDAGLIGCYEVGRGSDRPPALLKFDFHPGGTDAPVAVSLVGKGITFDSGGYSIKPNEGMFSMKFDMAGAATVVSALALAMMRGLDRRVRLYLCCAENLVSGHAYKLGDILRYPNGLSVEIANTDAEGRLVLADGLLLASADKPELIMNAATLTGAAFNAVGPEFNAVFCRKRALADRFLAIAEEQRERHWPLPLEPFHAKACPSPYADTMNSRPIKGGGPGGASNAAAFLSRFVDPDIDWVHVDLAAAYNEKDTARHGAGATGQGVLTLAAALANGL